MTRAELLDLLTVERFAPTVHVERTSHIQPLDSDPDAEEHAAELLAALGPSQPADTIPEQPSGRSDGSSTPVAQFPQRPVDGGLPVHAQPAFNSRPAEHRKGA